MILNYSNKTDNPVSRIILGTAQFGLCYGITNQRAEQVPFQDVKDIIGFCKANNIVQLDTAAVYGNSEAVLGALGINDILVDTKLPPRTQLKSPCSISDAVTVSLSHLNHNHLNTLYFHNSADLLDYDVQQLADELNALKSQGIIRKVGVSIYDPEELALLFERFSPDVIQVPYNLFDRRIVASGWAKQLCDANVEINARSAFLQGVLLEDAAAYHRYPSSWLAYLKRYDSWCASMALTKLQAVLGDVFSCPYLSKIVLGVHSLQQLQQILSVVEALPQAAISVPDFNVPRELFDPREWAAL